MKESSEELLAVYAERRAEEVFHELVRRHIALVYNTALRVANGDAHLAQDVAQTVFSDLARKAASISSGTVVSGWLYQHTWFTASKMIRTERRRQMREQNISTMQSGTSDETDQTELQSALDDALTSLKPEERDVVVLRYFEQVELRRIGALFGISEDAAQKRVARAVEKLRDVFAARGLTVSGAALTTFLSSQSLAAPPALASVISSSAIVAAASGTGVGLAAFLAGTKGKLAVAAACALAVGTPLVWQQQKVNALNAEIGRLSAVVSSNEVLRVEIERLRGETLSAAEREEMNRRFLELQRLRGEITMLRNQAAEAVARGATKSPTDLAEGKFEASEVPQVLLETRVAELSHERMATLLKTGFPAVADPNNFNLKMNAETAATVLRLFEESEGVDLLAAPRMTTLDGREARVSVTDELALPDGSALPLGLEVNFFPTVLPDKQSTHLKIDLKWTEFLGWENESKTVPRLRTRSVEHQEAVETGEVVLLGRSVVLGEGDSRELKLQIYWFSSYLIDAAGNRWRRGGNKGEQTSVAGP
jgi:RNA polymerase sigma factor (sigma-70 family)